MIKRIIVGLDGSNFAKTATEIACQQASACNGTVVGVGVVDIHDIESAQLGAPPGAMYFAEKAEEHRLMEALEKVQSFLAEFESTCKHYKVKYELHSTEGVPFKAIVEEGKVADIIIIGLKTYYHFGTQSESGKTLKRVLENSVCPVLAVPEKLDPTKNIIIAYDGSMESAKTLRAFVSRFDHLFGKVAITLLTVTDDEDEGKVIQQEALNYLRCYDIFPTCIIKDGKPEDVILNVAADLQSPMITVGAFGKNKISKIFFGSTTQKLIDHCNVPLFLFH